MQARGPGFKDETGKTYGRLTVIKEAGRNKWGRATWHCQCKCGKQTVVAGNDLRSRHVKSCGCLKKEALRTQRKKQTLPKGEAALNGVYRGYKKRAQDRGLRWDITKRYFRKLTKKPCYYCGTEPSQVKGDKEYRAYNGKYVYNGLDRVDNDKGYTRGNIVACCKWCNQAKSDLSKEEFIIHCRKVTEHLE